MAEIRHQQSNDFSTTCHNIKFTIYWLKKPFGGFYHNIDVDAASWMNMLLSSIRYALFKSLSGTVDSMESC